MGAPDGSVEVLTDQMIAAVVLALQRWEDDEGVIRPITPEEIVQQVYISMVAARTLGKSPGPNPRGS